MSLRLPPGSGAYVKACRAMLRTAWREKVDIKQQRGGGGVDFGSNFQSCTNGVEPTWAQEWPVILSVAKAFSFACFALSQMPSLLRT